MKVSCFFNDRRCGHQQQTTEGATRAYDSAYIKLLYKSRCDNEPKKVPEVKVFENTSQTVASILMYKGRGMNAWAT